MLKDFFTLLDWFRVAALLRFKKSKILFKEGEVWWCSVGMNIGIEIYGKGPNFARPILVLEKLDANSFLAIPLTTQLKNGTWYHPIRYTNGLEVRAILSQARIFDKKRLLKRIETLEYADFCVIRQSFVDLYGQ